jgi:hypothetical protein
MMPNEKWADLESHLSAKHTARLHLEKHQHGNLKGSLNEKWADLESHLSATHTARLHLWKHRHGNLKGLLDRKWTDQGQHPRATRNTQPHLRKHQHGNLKGSLNGKWADQGRHPIATTQRQTAPQESPTREPGIVDVRRKAGRIRKTSYYTTDAGPLGALTEVGQARRKVGRPIKASPIDTKRRRPMDQPDRHVEFDFSNGVVERPHKHDTISM